MVSGTARLGSWPNLRGCLIVGAVACIESAAHTPSRVSCGSSHAFAITTGSSRSRQVLASGEKSLTVSR
jgi:hypothetical protein